MQDWVPTLMAAAGEPDIKEKLKKGHKADGKKFKVHLDGFNMLPYMTGKEDKSPRKEFFYFSDDGSLVGVRHKQWKLVFAEQRAKNVHVHEGISEQEFVDMRSARDSLLDMPRLILPSVQVNMRAGEMPPPEDNGVCYLKMPVDAV